MLLYLSPISTLKIIEHHNTKINIYLIIHTDIHKSLLDVPVRTGINPPRHKIKKRRIVFKQLYFSCANSNQRPHELKVSHVTDS